MNNLKAINEGAKSLKNIILKILIVKYLMSKTIKKDRKIY